MPKGDEAVDRKAEKTEKAASPKALWLRAAFGAPMLLALSGACLTVCVGDGTFAARLGESIRGVIVAPFVALLCGGVLVGVDSVLALLKLRARPVGTRAWLSAGVATLGAGVVSWAVGAALRGTIKDEIYAAIVLGLGVAIATGARLYFGKRPGIEVTTTELAPVSAAPKSKRV